jgi:hypothetical protein
VAVATHIPSSFGPCRLVLGQRIERKAGNWNEKSNRELGSRTGADVVGSEGRRTRRRRCARGRIGCRSARADRSRGWRSGGLYGRAVDFTFMGPAPIERTAPGPEIRDPGRSCSCRRRSTCAQSVCAQRSSSSRSGRPSTAVHHQHGFHCAAGPATRVSRFDIDGAIRARGFGPAPLFQARAARGFESHFPPCPTVAETVAFEFESAESAEKSRRLTGHPFRHHIENTGFYASTL